MFKKIFGYNPNFNNKIEDNFWDTIMYRIRFERDLSKKQGGRNSFKKYLIIAQKRCLIG